MIKHCIGFFSLLLLFHMACFSQISEQELLDKIQKYTAENNPQKAAESLNKLAFYYWETGKYEKAIHQFEQSVAFNKNTGNNNAVKAIYSNIGMIYSDMGQPESSLVFFRKSLLISREQNKKPDIGTNLINIAVALKHLNRNEEALKNAQEALTIVTELNNRKLMRSCFGLLAEIHEELGNSQKSMEYFSMYASFEKQIQQEKVEQEKKQAKQQVDKISKEKKQTEQKLEVTKDSLKKAEEINEKNRIKMELQELTIKQKEAEIKNKRLLSALFISIAAVFAILALFVLRSYRQKKRHNKELQQRNEEIREKNRKIGQSINYAKNIQGALLPEENQLASMFPESFVLFSPRDVVSGDFYWFNQVQNKKVVAAVDCTGHGVPGAFMSMLGMSFLQEIVLDRNILEPVEILEQMHVMVKQALKQENTGNSDGMDMAIIVYDEKTKELSFAGAVNPLVYMQDDEMHVLKGDFFGIGGQMKGNERKFSQTKITLDKPTTLYLFSDGFADQFGGEKGRKYFLKNFKALLFNIHKLPMNQQLEKLSAEFDEWKGDAYQRVDDVLVIGLRID